MNTLLPWLRIFLAVFVYIAVALLTSVLIRKLGTDLKNMEERTAGWTLLIGAISNLVILILVGFLLVFLDQRSLTSLGLLFTSNELVFSAVSVLAIVILAVAYIGILSLQNKTKLTLNKSGFTRQHLRGFIGGLAVLLVVALQEEVLYRGYITLNLLQYGPLIIILVSTVLFVAIHFLTNRVSFYQIVSWTIGGAILSISYLVTGSIWVPIILHFATDATNLIIFNIVGKYSLFEIIPALTKRQLAGYRLVYAFGLITLLLVFFGYGFRIV